MFTHIVLVLHQLYDVGRIIGKDSGKRSLNVIHEAVVNVNLLLGDRENHVDGVFLHFEIDLKWIFLCLDELNFKASK